MRITPINYEEATALLEIADGTIKHAVGRGVLTRLPRVGLTQPLIKEQVELFKGKRLSLKSLSTEERKRWQELNDAACKKEVPSIPATPVVPPISAGRVSPATPVYLTDRAGLEYMNERGIAMKVAQTATGETIFLPAPADELDHSEESMEGGYSMLLLMAILVGLAILLFYFAAKKRDAAIKAESTIESIGIDKETLATNQREVLTVLRSHPQEVQTLKTILESENLLAA